MQDSKRKWGLTILFAVVALSVGACSPTKKTEADLEREKSMAAGADNASFAVISVQGESHPARKTPGWNLPQSKLYNFTACLIERGSNQKILGHRFKVNSPKGYIEADTDHTGCLRWQEEVEFNFFADSKYLVYEREIVANGVHNGKTKVEYAINPWGEFRKSPKPEFIDLRKNQVEERLAIRGADNIATALAGDRGGVDQLLLDSLKINIRKIAPQSNSVRLAVEMHSNPSVRLTNIAGEPVVYRFNKGKFRVSAHLVAANVGAQSDRMSILTTNTPSSVSSINQTNGQLIVNVKTDLGVRSTTGNLDFAVRVLPVDGPSLDAFEAVYSLGDFDSIVGSKSPTLKAEIYENDTEQQSKFKFDQFIATADNFAALQTHQSLEKLQPFEFEIMKIRFEQIMPGETATTRTVKFRVGTCISDTLTGKKVVKQRFKIKINGGKEFVKSTRRDGCLPFLDTIRHKYYQPENLFERRYEITHVDSGFTTTLRAYVNPWDDKWTFGRDARELEASYITELKNRKKIPSRFLIKDYDYGAIRFLYEIDEFMTLHVKKTLLLDFDPVVLRYNGIVNGRKTVEDARDGLYLMKVAVHKHYLDPASRNLTLNASGKTHSERITKKEFITVVKKIVRVQDGRVITPIEISVSDLRLMRIRANFLIQMETIDEQLLLVSNAILEEDKKRIREMLGLTTEERKNERLKSRDKVHSLITELKKAPPIAKEPHMKRIDYVNYTKGSLKQFNISEKLSKKALEAIKDNDFTINPAAPIVELDKIIDHDSGLERRTFTGPVIMLKNGWSSQVRPTDNLDENNCVFSDCDQIKNDKRNRRRGVNIRQMNAKYIHSAYYGAVNYLADKHVDDLIERKEKLENERRRNLTQMSMTKNFLKFFRLKYVSLEDKPLQELSKDCNSQMFSKKDSECFQNYSTEDSIASADFIKILNDIEFYGVKPTDKLKLRRLIHGHKPDFDTKARLCRMLVTQTLQSANQGRESYKNYIAKELTNHCVHKNLVVERKHRVLKTGEFFFTGSKQMNINVGANVSLSHSQGIDNSASIGRGFGLLKIDASVKEGRSKGDGTSISEATFLVMQEASFDIELTKFERCAVLRLDPTMFEYMRVKNLMRMIGAKMEGELPLSDSKGIFLCSGEIVDENAPLKDRVIRERFYYFAQHFTEGDMLDNGDLYNHPWLLALRGLRDMYRFVSMLKLNDQQLFSISKDSWWPFARKVVEGERWPIEKMVKVYKKILPSFPGIYSVIGDQPDYPFKENPTKNFEQLKEQ